jgi:NADH-ubiquinone reductase complex 1 MLRQ subunit
MNNQQIKNGIFRSVPCHCFLLPIPILSYSVNHDELCSEGSPSVRNDPLSLVYNVCCDKKRFESYRYSPEQQIRESHRCSSAYLLTKSFPLIPRLLLDSSYLASQCRFQSTKTGVSTTFLTMGKDRTFKKNWLGDPSVYPLLVALSCACTMAAGVGISCLANNPDVRISNSKKHSTVRDWGLR